MASPPPTPDVPRVDGLNQRARVELHPRPGNCPVPTEGPAFIHPRRSWRTGRLGAGVSRRRHAGYCLERRHPAARASPSVQNHRSPFDVLIRVCS